MQEIQPAGNKLGRNQADAVRRIARLMKDNAKRAIRLPSKTTSCQETPYPSKSLRQSY